MGSKTTRISQIVDPVAQIIRLPRPMPGVLGMGAHLKASLCLIKGDQALISNSVGDMGSLEAVEHYDLLVEQMLTLAGSDTIIACVAHDLHPDFHSTHRAASLGCQTLGVQHHHAHALATQAEHGREGLVLGLMLDGFGLGEDGGSWGGELLLVDGTDYQRLGHLALMAQPGGDIAAREPWRMGAAALHQLGRGGEIGERFADQPHAGALVQILDKQLNSTETSSCGRLFDAACGLLNVYPVAQFEGQAAMALEALSNAPEVMAGGWQISESGVLDFSPLLGVLVDMQACAGANLFHGTLVAGLAEWVMLARNETGVETVAFGGGCFLNRVMTGLLETDLSKEGMTVLKPEKLSPGDASLSFGQAIAAALVMEKQI